MAFLKTMWKANSKHKKLLEELSLQNNKESESDVIEPLYNENDIVTFSLKYLGSTIIEKVSSANGCKEAVKNILKSVKAFKGKKKLQRVNVNVSLNGIDVLDLHGNDIFKISIYRISNCSTDSSHPQIFSFLATDANEIMECHAFLCPKRKVAETVTLAVAQAFNAVYEAWKILPGPENLRQKTPALADSGKNSINTQTPQKCVLKRNVLEEKLIDFDSDEEQEENFQFNQSSQKDCVQWVCFEEELIPIARTQMS